MMFRHGIKMLYLLERVAASDGQVVKCYIVHGVTKSNRLCELTGMYTIIF